MIDQKTRMDRRTRRYVEQADRLIAEQYEDGLEPQKISPGWSYLLLLDSGDQVIAAAILVSDPRLFEEVGSNGVTLPQYHPPKCIGQLANVAGGDNTEVMMPGVVLQRKILQAFKAGKLGIDILTAANGVEPKNLGASYLAARQSGLKMVVRRDVYDGIDLPGGKPHFIAITNNGAISLVPEGKESEVLTEEALRTISKSYLKTLREERTKPGAESSCRYLVIDKRTPWNPSIERYIKEANNLRRRQWADNYQSQLFDDTKTDNDATRTLIEAGDLTYFVLLKNDHVVARGELRKNLPQFNNHCNDVELPCRLAKMRIGDLMWIAAGQSTGLQMPGLELQRNILKTFQAGELDVDILTGRAFPQNLWTFHQAATSAQVHHVVRSDLSNWNEGPESLGGKSHFVACARDPELSLVPAKRHGAVMDETQIRAAAKEYLRIRRDRKHASGVTEAHR